MTLPALPDADRLASYTIVSPTTGPFNCNFQIYADGADPANWIQVWLSGVRQIGNLAFLERVGQPTRVLGRGPATKKEPMAPISNHHSDDFGRHAMIAPAAAADDRSEMARPRHLARRQRHPLLTGGRAMPTQSAFPKRAEVAPRRITCHFMLRLILKQEISASRGPGRRVSGSPQ
jgi:hypothetical protein